MAHQKLGRRPGGEFRLAGHGVTGALEQEIRHAAQGGGHDDERALVLGDEARSLPDGGCVGQGGAAELPHLESSPSVGVTAGRPRVARAHDRPAAEPVSASTALRTSS